MIHPVVDLHAFLPALPSYIPESPWYSSPCIFGNADSLQQQALNCLQSLGIFFVSRSLACAQGGWAWTSCVQRTLAFSLGMLR